MAAIGGRVPKGVCDGKPGPSTSGGSKLIRLLMLWVFCYCYFIVDGVDLLGHIGSGATGVLRVNRLVGLQ